MIRCDLKKKTSILSSRSSHHKVLYHRYARRKCLVVNRKPVLEKNN